jgi:hypothetical protein
MYRMKKFLKWLSLIVLLSILVVGCGSQADTASQNLSKAADSFEITRRIVFYNGITGEDILVIEGLCSLGNYDEPGSLSVTCRVGHDQYKKHFLGLSDNVTYFAEQIDSYPADPFHYRVIFKPETLIPDIDLQTSP